MNPWWDVDIWWTPAGMSPRILPVWGCVGIFFSAYWRRGGIYCTLASILYLLARMRIQHGGVRKSNHRSWSFQNDSPTSGTCWNIAPWNCKPIFTLVLLYKRSVTNFYVTSLHRTLCHSIPWICMHTLCICMQSFAFHFHFIALVAFLFTMHGWRALRISS